MTVKKPDTGFHTCAADARWLPAAGGRLLAGASDTGGRLTVIDSTVPPHDAAPLHRHLSMDESLMILDGRFTVTCGARDFDAAAGDLVHLPRAVPHRYVAGEDGGRMLIISTPGGLERFFDDWESGMEIAAAARASDIEFLR